MASLEVAGSLSGSVVEDTQFDAYGAVFVTGGGAGTFLAGEFAGQYGTLSLQASGDWHYTLNNAGAAVQGLAANAQAHELFVVTWSEDGVQGVIDIAVTGVNDSASFSGEFIKMLDVNAAAGLTGQLNSHDPDVGDKNFQIVDGLAGVAGTFSIDKSGLWRYELLPGQQTAIADQGKSLVENFVVASTDGSVTQVSVLVTTDENVAPAVTGFNPADGATGVPLGASLVFTFSEAIQRGSGSIVLKTSGGAVVASYDAATSLNLSLSGSSLTLDPTAELAPGTGYVVEFAAGSIKDLAGNNLPGTSAYNFTTGQPNPPIVGGPGADALGGTAGADTIQALEGNDTLEGGAGNDTLEGGSGRDTAVYSAAKGSYVITRDDDGVITVIGPDGTDTLIGVERLDFSDVMVAFDVAGTAGQAYRLYQAAFDRTPDIGGLGFQMRALDDGWGLVSIAQNFIDSPEFKATYGALNDQQYVEQLYLNVLDRAGEAEGVAYHLNDLGRGLSRAQLLSNFSESPENQAAVIGVIENGMVYTV